MGLGSTYLGGAISTFFSTSIGFGSATFFSTTGLGLGEIA